MVGTWIKFHKGSWQKVIIFGHIPPGKFERFYQFCGEEKGCDLNGGYHGFHWLREDLNSRCSGLLCRRSFQILFSDILKLWNSILKLFRDNCLHTTILTALRWNIFLSFKKAKEKKSIEVFMSAGENIPVGWALLAPGVSPMNSTLAPETGANNPGLRLFKYNKETGQVITFLV